MKTPRKNTFSYLTPSETLIYKAMGEIENIGADERLTSAQEYLQKAKDLISDYIDEQLKK